MHSRFVLFSYLCLIISVALFVACGSTGNSSSNNGNNASGSTNPGGGSGSAGSGSGSGGSGSSGSGGAGGSATGAAYFYVAIAGNNARIRGYKIDSSAASLAEVPGSPFNQQGGEESGVVAVSRNFVYGSEVQAGQGTPITAFRADPSTGSLTQIGTPVTTQKNGQALLFPDSTGHDLYEVTNTGDVITLIINSDGTLTDSGSRLHLAGQVGSFAISPNGQLAYATVTNGSPRDGTFSDALLALNRDSSSGNLSLSHQVNSNQHLSELQFDSSGRYLLAIGGSTGNQIVVYSVNSSSGDATPVTGSPYTVTKPPQPPAPDDYVRTFRLDPASRFVYVLEGNAAQPQSEYFSVFSFGQANGALVPVQTVDMPSGNLPASLLADQSLVFIVSVQSGSVAGNIHVFRRDSATGMLTESGNTVSTQTPLWDSAEMRF